MSATNSNRVSHFWASQNAPFGSQETQFWETNIYVWVFFFESIIKFLQVTKTFASCKVFVNIFLYYFTFQTPTYWNCYLHKHLLSDEVFQSWQFFLFLGTGFANIPSIFWFHMKFKQGIQRHWNILNSTFETIYQVPR